MFKILVICKNYEATKKLLFPLFAHSQLFAINFYITDTMADTLEAFVRHKPQLFMVYMEGSDLEDIKFMQQLSSSTPIIAIGRGDDENAAIAAYQKGAIDYVHLPIGSREFYYRLAAKLQLLHLVQNRQAANTLSVGDLRISLKTNQVFLGSEFIPLTATEYKILLMLATNLNSTVTTGQLYKELWSVSDLGETSRTLSMHISKLRRKLGLSQFTPLNIVTIHKKGYCLSFENDDDNHKSSQVNSGGTSVNGTDAGTTSTPSDQMYTANINNTEAHYERK